MSRKQYLLGNWKMNPNLSEARSLLQGLAKLRAKVDVVVFPPFVYLPMAQQLLQDSVIAWGAQNVHTQSQGAFTGDIAAPMLAAFGCCYVLVGHSERRQGCGETNQMVATKFQAAQDAGLTPVLCVGETQTERDNHETANVVLGQCQAVIDYVGINAFDNSVVAYEPVWAIGTGVTATSAQAQAVHRQIREHFTQIDGIIGQRLPLLYGGSMKPDNALELLRQDDIDGGLVGGASLDLASFSAIIEAAEIAY